MAFILILLVPVIFLVAILAQTWDRKLNSGRKPWMKCLADTVCSYIMVLRLYPWGATAYPGVVLLCDQSALWGTTERLIKDIMGKKDLAHAGGSITTLGHNYDLILLGILRSRSTISPFGHVFIHESLRQKLEQRLGLVKFMDSHPHIASIPVKRPIFITGMARTGTTFMHDLLGLHSDGKSHLLWEQLSGIPETADESIADRKADRKIRRMNIH